MKHKLTIEIIEQILECEVNFRPPELTARITKLDADTIYNWIQEGRKLLEERTILYPLTKLNFKNFSEEEILMYLAESIDHLHLKSQVLSWDKYIATGKKEELKMFLTKEAIRTNPKNTIEIAVASVNLFDKQDSEKPPSGNEERKILSSDIIKAIEEKKKQG